jgi:hypothetical protein
LRDIENDIFLQRLHMPKAELCLADLIIRFKCIDILCLRGIDAICGFRPMSRRNHSDD